MADRPKISAWYRFAMAASTPTAKWWGRMEVTGLDALPPDGPVLLAGNHDSYWDPVSIGIAGLPRRQIKALAKSSLWKPGLGTVLDGMGQIPIERGRGDRGAMDRAIEELRGGSCIGIFPEGTRSLGRELPAKSGFGRLAEAVPEAEIVCVQVTGTADVTTLGKRPKIRIHFFRPEGGPQRADENAKQFSQRLLDEIRAQAPRENARRKPVPPVPA